MKRIAATAILGITLILTLTASSPSEAAEDRGFYCRPGFTRSYIPNGMTWYSYDGGTVKNSSPGTVTKTFTHTKSSSATTTISAEIGVSAAAAVAEVNAKFGVGASVTASYSKSTKFSVTVPPRTTVRYRDGIVYRNYRVQVVQTYSNCNTRTVYGIAKIADNHTEVR